MHFVVLSIERESNSAATATSSIQTVAYKQRFALKISVLLGEMAYSGLGQEMHKKSLEHQRLLANNL